MRSFSRRSLASLPVLLCFFAACGRDAPRPDPASATALAAAGSAPATPETTRTGEVTVDRPPPSFKAKDQNGVELDLSALKGRPVVVYFYPRDETPGCTAEAKGLRDVWTQIAEAGAVVIGISRDSPESHRAFAKHHELPFHLVTDESMAIAQAFGVPRRIGLLARQSFVIGADGNVKRIYRDVDVSRHARDVLADLQQR